MKSVSFYTDGSCLGNGKQSNVGGWAYVMVETDDDESIKVTNKAGSKQNTTNNEMELTATYMALVKAYKSGYRKVTIYSDSAYVVNAISKNWLLSWYANNWCTAEDKPIKNETIWKKVYKLIYQKGIAVRMQKVAGHKGDPLNELADRLAVKASESIKEE